MTSFYLGPGYLGIFRGTSRLNKLGPGDLMGGPSGAPNDNTAINTKRENPRCMPIEIFWSHSIIYDPAASDLNALLS